IPYSRDLLRLLCFSEMNNSENKSRERIDKDFCLHSGLVISPPAMTCQVRWSNIFETNDWQPRSSKRAVCSTPQVSFFTPPRVSVSTLRSSPFSLGRLCLI